MTSHHVRAGRVTFGNDLPLVVIAGPCQLETLDHARQIAEELVDICNELGLGYVFKASFDKANRSSIKGARGPGLDEGLRLLDAIRTEFAVPVLTDIHLPQQAQPVAEVADIIQIPAFLCRQTDLLVAAAKTDAVINVKKGQFLAPWDMAPVVEKITAQGRGDVLLTERGTTFGYNTLVTDMRALPQLAQTGWPVIMDATHAVQQPGGNATSSGGQRQFAPVLARAAVALGIAGLFLETHQNPDKAPSDGPNMIPLHNMRALLAQIRDLDTWAKQNPV